MGITSVQAKESEAESGYISEKTAEQKYLINSKMRLVQPALFGIAKT